jgi:hypothetical protein
MVVQGTATTAVETQEGIAGVLGGGNQEEVLQEVRSNSVVNIASVGGSRRSLRASIKTATSREIQGIYKLNSSKEGMDTNDQRALGAKVKDAVQSVVGMGQNED